MNNETLSLIDAIDARLVAMEDANGELNLAGVSGRASNRQLPSVEASHDSHVGAKSGRASDDHHYHHHGNATSGWGENSGRASEDQYGKAGSGSRQASTQDIGYLWETNKPTNEKSKKGHSSNSSVQQQKLPKFTKQKADSVHLQPVIVTFRLSVAPNGNGHTREFYQVQ